MQRPVTEHLMTPHGPTVASFGGGPHALSAALAYVKSKSRAVETLISPPSGPALSGFKEIRQSAPQFELAADGLVVARGRAVLVYSRDCPVVTFANARSPDVVVCHAGRPALNRTLGPAESVIDRAIAALERNHAFRHQVVAHIAASICQTCFEHRGPQAAMHTAYFREHYPSTVRDPGGHLDLLRVIALQCQEQGVLLSNISHDRVCTKEHPDLASHRNGDEQSNITVIIT